MGRWKEHTGIVYDLSFILGDDYALSAGDDGATILWSLQNARWVAKLYALPSGSWAVVAPDGRFDTNDLAEIQELHWVLPEDPFTPQPLEIFMRDYYEPRLLPRILKGEKFIPVRDLSELNRVQPEVRITAIEPDRARPDSVLVSVEARGTSRSYRPDIEPVITATHDLRLFRNGQLVGYADGKLAEAGAEPFEQTFSVRLPAESEPLSFTAYAFNDDRIKSDTARMEYKPPVAIQAERPRAYLIAVGVNHHDNPSWDLHYAANDARKIGESIAERLQTQGQSTGTSSLLPAK